ncbi:hypothetical protein [Flavobacterium cerinum]|uniref:Uncharacterized protein n=1 Tax=Flavobacterium cerinum TaxID=2502784 RepID=A0A3S3R1X8_9FLAO|nr:hypothetical protein [Flavobacterium cerinum]RWX03348.1 hypothetical protein EPI11_00015 [Flavobacterium cerinum]
MEHSIMGIITDNYGGFFYESAEKARQYFISHGVDLSDVKCAMPSYIHRNLEFILASPDLNPATPNILKDINGIKVIEGYEYKLIFYFPDWFYRPEIKPLEFDIPEKFKISTKH